MIINRHNYEEFFLLYVDNELNELDRVAVENFIQENADLAEEMKMLKQSVLPLENIAYEQKEALYNKANGISLNNYEEYFLLAVDKELTKQESEEVEKFVLKHPELQNEFTLLEQTRLEAELIVFAGKERLYKKEEKERRVIFVTWMKMSVAAAIIGLAVTMWLFSKDGGHNADITRVVTAGETIKRLPKTIQHVEPTTPVVNENLVTEHKKMPVKSAMETRPKMDFEKAAEQKLKKEVFAVNESKNKPEPQISAPTIVEKVAEVPAPDRKKFEQTIASARIEKPRNTDVVKEVGTDVNLTSKLQDDQKTALARHAVYREIDNQENEEENTFYIGSAEINKNKLKGLFKKATRFLSRKSDDNEDERTLKIAGFEIKSK